MPYIGQQPTSVAFLTDTFSGNGSTTAFTLSAAPAGTSSILVAISGVVQDPSTYSVVGTTLTFSPAPPTGTGNISVRFLGIPASGVTTTAYRTVTEFTATAGQTTFSVPSYTVGFIDVYRNGVLLGSADYTATSGVSVVLASGATAGDLVEVISFSVSSVLNAVQSTGTTFSGNVLFASGNGIWNTGGNVGVGTTTPNKGSVSRALTLNGTAGNIVEFCVNDSRVGWVYGDNNLTALSAGGARYLSLETNGAERMRIDSSGNAGVGTTATSNGRFSVFNTQSDGAQTIANAGILFGQSATGFAQAGIYPIGSSGFAGSLVFTTAASKGGPDYVTTERMRINSDGDLLVGTTTSEGRITISGNGCGGYIGSITNVNSSNCNPAHGLIFRAGFNGSASGSNYFSFRRPDNTVTGSITQTGSTTISYNTSSDYRLKENITPMTGALAKVSALNPVTYTWKEDGSPGQGFIAHELQAVVPDCVTGEKDAVDFEGNPEYQGIDTSFLVATLTAAIQELKAEVDSLKAEVTALKGTE